MEECMYLSNLLKSPIDTFTKAFKVLDEETTRMEINDSYDLPNYQTPSHFSIESVQKMDSKTVNFIAQVFVENFEAILYDWNRALSDLAIGIACHPETKDYYKDVNFP